MHREVSTALRRVWRSRIWSDYREGLIASESELQACVYFHLREELIATCAGRARIFVEPTMRDLVGDRRPDMVVAVPSEGSLGQSFDVLAVLELKLDRGKDVRYKDELDRIERFGSTNCVTMDNQRPDNNTGHISLNIGERTRYFIGCIGGHKAAAVYPQSIRDDDKGFAIRNPHLARQTTILYGRVYPDGASLFADEDYVDVPATSGAT